jgi:hypothetical protein
MVILLPILIIIILVVGYFILKSEYNKMEEIKTAENSSNETVIEEKKNPAFHLFLYLVAFLALGFLVAGEIIVFFQMINKFVPDPESLRLNYSYVYYDNDALKFGLSALIVALPIYFFCADADREKAGQKRDQRSLTGAQIHHLSGTICIFCHGDWQPDQYFV